jgi:release factor glutamine methyltransferase
MLNELLQKLKNAGIPDAEVTLDVLCAYVKQTDYSTVRLLRITNELSFSDAEKKELGSLVLQRSAGEPLEYITGEREFYGFLFRCKKNVLIPRNDTEILVDTVLDFLKDGDSLLDLCSGTGCVGISAAKRRKINLVLSDISPYALSCAKENAERLLPEDDVQVIYHDVFRDTLKDMFDVITANPPYITAKEMGSLDADVKKEPSLALFGGEDGLDFYRAIAARYRSFIKDGGYLFFEIGAKQGEAVFSILEKNGYEEIQIKKDYNAKDRVVFARKTK